MSQHLQRVALMAALVMVAFGLGIASIGAATLYPGIERSLCYLCGVTAGVAASLPFIWK